SAALGVLAGKPHRIALVDKRRESKRLAHCPVDALACLDHLAPIVEEAPNGAMDVESVGNRSEATTDFGEPRAVDAGAATAIVLDSGLRRLKTGPAAVEPIGFVGREGFAGFERGFEMVAPIRLQLRDLVIGQHPLVNELRSVNLERRLV